MSDIFNTEWACVNNDKLNVKYYDKKQHEGKIKDTEGNDLIYCKIQRTGTEYFRHKNLSINNHNYKPMTDWHIEMQKIFPPETHEQYLLVDETTALHDRRVDVMIKKQKTTIEIQHSRPHRDEVNLRNEDHKIHGYNCKWLINGGNSIQIFNNNNDENNCVLRFVSDNWKHYFFKSCDTIFIEKDGLIYIVDPKIIVFDSIRVPKPITHHEFKSYIYGECELPNNENIRQTNIYSNKKGAGSGKTYDICRLPNDIDNWNGKNTFILLTKQKSNICGIRKQIQEHVDQNILDNLKFIKYEELDNNKFLFEFERVDNGTHISVFGGTLDAFIFSVCGKIENQGTCPFRERVKHMGNVPNLSDSGTTTFGKTISVSNKTLICIDEAQDNDMLYCSGFTSLALKTYADIYLCGDTLQCLKHEKNLLTDTNEILNDGNFIKFHDDGNTNNTRRFGPSISNFVNELIHFEKYGRPRMTSDFTDEERFNEVFKNRRKPNNVLSGVNIEHNLPFHTIEDVKNKWYNDFIKNIKELIETYHLVPEDIIISFPLLKDNEQAYNLEIEMNQMWIKLFDNPKYINNTLKYHPYWKNQNKVSDYCQLH